MRHVSRPSTHSTGKPILSAIASTNGFLVNVFVDFMMCFLPLLDQQDPLQKKYRNGTRTDRTRLAIVIGPVLSFLSMP